MEPRNHAGPSQPQIYHQHTSSTSSSIRRRQAPNPNPPTPISPNRNPGTHVQAIHDFDPTRVASAVASNSNLYLRFKAGDIIRVHTRDERGWWDGEVSTSDEKREGPRRGWFPSNYVREMGWDGGLHRRNESVATTASSPASRRDMHARQDSTMSQQSQSSTMSPTSPTKRFFPALPTSYQPLLVPIIQALSLLQSAIDSSRPTHLQPSTAYVISAIRAGLAQADCLSKESETLTRWPVLAKERKIVLVELSKLVACARTASGEGNPTNQETAMENTAKAARNVLSSVQRFLSTASDLGVEVREAPPEELEISRNSSVASGRVRSPPPGASGGGNSRIQETFKHRAASIADLRAARKRSESPPPPLPTAGLIGQTHSTSMKRSGSRNSSDLITPISTTFTYSSGSGHSSPVSIRSERHRRRPHGNSMDSSTSESFQYHFEEDAHTPEGKYRSASIGELKKSIDKAEERLFSLIAAMVGHIHVHSHGSHPSSHALLIEITRDTVNSIRELLTCVEAIATHQGVYTSKPTEVDELHLIKDDLYQITSELVDATEVVANAPFESDTQEEEWNLEKKRLLMATTSTLRISSECLRAVRACMPEEENEDDLGRLHSTPRAGDALGNSLRLKPVGIRGVHILSSLHRKASSLSHLQRRYEGEGIASSVEDDDEEFVADMSREEDMTMRPVPLSYQRPPIQQTMSTPMLGTSGSRSRSTSLSSPAPPPRIQHRSPSRSADLDKFTGDYDIKVDLPRRPRPSSTYSMNTPDMARSSAGSQQTTNTAPQTPESGTEGSPILGYLKSDLPTKIADLRIDTEATPVKRPTHARSITAPSQTANGDVRFWLVAHDYDPREISFNPEGNMIGASLAVLVEKMTPHDGPVDPTFSDTFFFTFRLYTSPPVLLDELIRRYDLSPPASSAFGDRERALWVERKVVPVRLRIYNFLKTWLDNHWIATSDEVILPTLYDFTANIVSRTLPAMAPRLLDSIRKRGEPLSAISEKSTSSRYSTGNSDRLRVMLPPSMASLPPTPVISKSVHSLLAKSNGNNTSNISITDFDTLELARQLTIMESKLFCAVVPEDLLTTGKRNIPELKALSTLSNQVTGWVADSILNEQDAKKRAGLLKYYIKLADKCLMVNNFSTMFAVLAGLNSSTIMRLKKTWELLSAKHRLTMDKLGAIIEHRKNHAAYRAKLREVTGACLPFLGLILTDITFTTDGNPDTRPSTLAPEMPLINHDKYTKLGKIAMDFKRYQEPFNFHELEAVQVFLKKVLAERGSTSLDALYRKSLLLEPRAGGEKTSLAVEKPGWLGGRI